MFTSDPQDYLIALEEYAANLSPEEEEAWATWQKRQQEHGWRPVNQPLYAVSISCKGAVRYCAGAEFNEIQDAVAFVANNPTRRGFQGISCLLPKI